MHIAIAGNIGSGKSTLTRLLARHYGWKPHYEQVANNPYLEDYYRDIKRWSFPLEVFYLKERFKDLMQLQKQQEDIVQDRSIYEGVYVFTANNHDLGNLDDRDFETYMELFEDMTDVVRYPDLMVYLRCSVGHLASNIEKRGRSYEEQMPLRYLESLNRRYEDFITKQYQGRVLIIEADELDFLANPSDLGFITDKIDRELFSSSPTNKGLDASPINKKVKTTQKQLYHAHCYRRKHWCGKDHPHPTVGQTLRMDSPLRARGQQSVPRRLLWRHGAVVVQSPDLFPQQAVSRRRGHRQVGEDRHPGPHDLRGRAHLRSQPPRHGTDERPRLRQLYRPLRPHDESRQVARPPLYIRSSIPHLIEHIQRRGRDYEQTIRIDYLRGLGERYEEWIKTYQGPMIIVDGDKNDFLDNPADFQRITEMIDERLYGLFPLDNKD